jgi:hypothetical protein
MFQQCTSLTVAPALPATTLASSCYSGMFSGCPLTTAPELPATTLANYCYYNMFYYCTSLTKAPVLIAEDVPLSGYQQMFNYCKNLNEITCYAKTFGNNATKNWVSNVASTGTFYKDFETEWTSGTSGIPSGWTIINANEPTKTYTATFKNYDGTVLETLTLEAGQTPTYSGATPTKPSTDEFEYKFIGWSPTIGPIENDMEYIAQFEEIAIPQGDPADDLTLPYVTFRAETAGSSIKLSNKSLRHTLEYSTDKTTWNTFNTSTSSIYLFNVGDEVYVRGYLSGSNQTALEVYRTTFEMYGSIAAYGNCNALWNYEDLNAPLKGYCGNNLFYGCTALTKAPLLPSTALAEGCYSNMFTGCSRLKEAPELPAAVLKDYCYSDMFARCVKLTKTPVLPATATVNNCYTRMFSGCSALSEVTCLATNIYVNSNFDECTQYWLNGVASTGTFYKNPDMTSWSSVLDGIPSGWTVLDYTA